VNPLVLGSSPSGPTNLRCSGTIEEGRDSLQNAGNAAEDRGHSDISGVTFGVTLGALLELPPGGSAFDAKKLAPKRYANPSDSHSRVLIRFRNLHFRIIIVIGIRCRGTKGIVGSAIVHR
jgi:hypothetical protein